MDIAGRIVFQQMKRPLTPALEIPHALVWKRYAVFSKAAEVFLHFLQEEIERKTAT